MTIYRNRYELPTRRTLRSTPEGQLKLAVEGAGAARRALQASIKVSEAELPASDAKAIEERNDKLANATSEELRLAAREDREADHQGTV